MALTEDLVVPHLLLDDTDKLLYVILHTHTTPSHDKSS